MQMNDTTRAVRLETEIFMTYTTMPNGTNGTVYVWACVRLRHVHGILSYVVSDSCSTKTTKIIFIHFLLLIFPFPFRTRFFIFFRYCYR